MISYHISGVFVILLATRILGQSPPGNDGYSQQMLGQNQQNFNQNQPASAQNLPTFNQQVNSNQHPVQGMVNPFLHSFGSLMFALMEIGKDIVRTPFNFLNTAQNMMTGMVNSYASPPWQPPVKNSPDIQDMTQKQQGSTPMPGNQPILNNNAQVTQRPTQRPANG